MQLKSEENFERLLKADKSKVFVPCRDRSGTTSATMSNMLGIANCSSEGNFGPELSSFVGPCDNAAIAKVAFQRRRTIVAAHFGSLLSLAT